MREILIQQYYKGETKAVILIGCKALSLRRIMTVLKEEASTNFVPAVAVIRKRRALFGQTGCKGFLGCFLYVKNQMSKLNFGIFFNTKFLE